MHALTRSQPPEWASAKPKGFAWMGLAMTCAMMIITNSGLRGILPGTICLTWLTLMWLESVLGVCVGRKIHGLLARRCWMPNDSTFEACASGACEPVRAGAGRVSGPDV